MAWANAGNLQVTWGSVSGKPSTFTPSSHTHAAGDVTSGTLPLARGGTGATSAASARESLSVPSRRGTVSAVSVGGEDSSGQYVQVDVTTNAGKRRSLYCKDNGFGLWNFNESKDSWTIPVTAKARGLEAYPVGAVYMSFVSTSPASLFGGSWSQISNRFIYAGNGTSTGGTLRHKHWIPVGKAVSDGMYVYDFNNNGSMFSGKNISGNRTLQGALMNFNSFDTFSTGPNAGFSAMLLDSTSEPVLGATDGTTSTAGESDLYPPYQMVYCWRRTA